ncbi:MAG: ParB/RepB/Spo0J family partition protein [Anaerolineaceae bacterium]|nr:ParB/RepB/Spo0J family partition protein [Anaerolineaceae bacterium]
MAKKRGLGKGLDALIPVETEKTASTNDGVLSISLNKIIPNPLQPRYLMAKAELEELAASIREHGIIQPVIVTEDAENDQFILIAGERRFRAARIAQLEAIPAIVRQATNQQRLELALIENVQRKDLTPLETAEAYRQLKEQFDLSHENIAIKVGKSRVSVTNTMRLLNLPEAAKEALAAQLITEGHARAILGLKNSQAQNAALQTTISQGLNVRQTEELVNKLLGQKPEKPTKPATQPEILELESQLRDRFGTKVTVNHGKKGGKVTIHYYSEEELNSLLDMMLKEQ